MDASFRVHFANTSATLVSGHTVYTADVSVTVDDIVFVMCRGGYSSVAGVLSENG